MTTPPADEPTETAGSIVTVGVFVVVGGVALISALGLFVFGHGDTDDGDVALAIRDYLGAFNDGDASEACDLETAAFQERVAPQDCESFYEESLAQFG